MLQLNRLKNRKLTIEKFEDRFALSATGVTIEAFGVGDNWQEDVVSSASIASARQASMSRDDVEAFLTSVGDPANYVTSAGQGLDGVVDVLFAFQRPDLTLETFRGSGSLLPTGNQVLTAAHNLFHPQGFPYPLQSITAFVNTPNGVSTIGAFQGLFHPTYNGTVWSPGDIAILNLVADAPADAERYDIYRDTDEVGNVIQKAGYGRAGNGIQGSVLASGTKRDGLNVVDAVAEALNGTGAVNFTIAANSHLLFDFDNGLAANDANGVALGINHTGLGANEVSTAPGDSGGPGFIGNLVAGVTSFGSVSNLGTDILVGLNSSFGEFAFDTRVSTYAPWIDAIIDETGLPTVTDITLSGSTWAPGIEYSYATLAPAGDQLKPIFTQNVDTLEIEFSEHVLFGQNGDELTLVGTNGQTLGPSDYSFSYDVGSHTGIWTFNNPIPSSKYRIELGTASITDTGNNTLDGEWEQPFSGTLDDFSDDAAATFPSGNGVEDGAGLFEFYFSVLTADVNQDGMVDSNDSSAADVTGDGIISSADINLIAAQQNTSLPTRVNRGDYLDDDHNNINDYVLWRMTFGTQDLRADGNGNGTIDLGDYTIWRDNLGGYSAWSTSPVGTPPAPIVIPGVGPQVENVVISGSNSQHDPYDFAVEMADSNWIAGDQLRTVPVGAADTISITFTEDVNVQASDLTVYGLQTANRPVLSQFEYDIASMTGTWTFTGWALGDNYLLQLSDSVTDVLGNPLDGEWINPVSNTVTNSSVSQFPSGDGNSGGDFSFAITLLPGDATLDGVVNQVDFDLLLNNWGMVDALFGDGDVNGDGFVAGSDLNDILIRWGFDYSALTILSDMDGDWDVDQDDVDFIFANRNLSSPTPADGDLDEDGTIDIDDFDLAFAQLGLELTAVA